MELVKITDLTARLGLSSRSLRYYEQMGLIRSVRPEFEKYRFYDADNIERLKQIMVLRKMQIPVKDVIRIYESEDMSTVVEIFVDRINAIDREAGALAELKRIVSEFLQTMTQNGVTKISALPLLYEKMDKQLDALEERKPAGYAELEAVSARLDKPPDVSIVDLPPMRALSSLLKEKPEVTDPDGFRRWVQANAPGRPGRNQQFEFQTAAGDVTILKIAADFENNTPYMDYIFEGGLFASANVYLDEDVGGRLRGLVAAFDGNKYYEIDYAHGGGLRHPALLENMISPDDQRELVRLYVPVKKRLADPALFNKPEEVTDITVGEIEAANPVLWTVDVALDKLIPINNAQCRILENGELEYIGYLHTRVLSTDVKVKLPFRIDIEFRRGEHKYFGLSDDSIHMYHGNHGLDHNYGFTVNADNESVRFHQPIFRDIYKFPNRGSFNAGEYNRLSWIIGEKHLACIINGEVRYCGINFPYMALDKSIQEPLPVIFGSSRLKYFKSIRVSQLIQAPKNKLRKEELIMPTKQSNNIIPVIHRLVTDEYGENYWFNGCAKYVMECLGEPDYNYWFFSGITGDIFTQFYAYTKSFWDAIDGYLFQENPRQFVKDIFAKCGYAATYVTKQEIKENTEMYLQTLVAYIDKGIPVISREGPCGVFVGYEEYGKILLYITGNTNQPERISFDQALQNREDFSSGWIFVGEKKEDIPLADIYREAIKAIPQYFNVKTDLYCFGPEAFRAWARDIENGKFDGMKPEEFDAWPYYTNYVCVLATNSGCCNHFLKKARELNPDMAFLDDISKLYGKTGDVWNDLEKLGGGFNITLEVLQDKDRRGPIAAKIREAAGYIDGVARIIKENLT